MNSPNGYLSNYLPVHAFLQSVNRNAMIFRLTLQIIKPKRLFLIIFFAVICQLSYAQTDKVVDSLRDVLKTAVEDTNKVKALDDLARRLGQIARYSEAENYAEKSLALAERLNYRKGMAYAYNSIGVTYRNQGKPEALKNLQASLKIAEEIGDKFLMANCYGNIGTIYKNQGNYPEALKNHMVSLKLKEDIGDKRGIALSYNGIGLINRHQGDYAEALKNHLAALKIAEDIRDKRLIALCQDNLGIVYGTLGDYAGALKNIDAALKIQLEVGDKHGAATSYCNRGIALKNLGNYTEALQSQFASLKIREEIGDKNGIASCYGNIAIVYNIQENYSEALKTYLSFLKFEEDLGNKDAIATAHGNIGKQYLQLKNYPEARKYLMNGLKISKEIGSKGSIISVYDGLVALESALGNHQQALAYFQLFAVYKDSLLNETNSQQIAQMKEQFESEKKDKEILQLTSDKQKLESEKQISALLLKTKNDSLIIAQAENDKVQLENDKIKLENERAQTLNLYNEQQIELLGNEKKLQQLQIEKNNADYAVQKAEVEGKQGQLLVLNKEKDIQALQLNKQKQTKNFLIAGIALLAILSFFLYRSYRTRQQLKLQMLRNKIASDLHDDVGSTLSSISIFSQMAQRQSKETIPLLESIGESSRKMLDAMADIVWTINPENDQFEKIISRMKSFAYELLGAKNIDFEFVADEEIEKLKLPMEVRKNLYLIFKEATNNMVKYANANKAMFAIKGGKNDLTMMIRDNGKGFDINESNGGNGLKNMKKRATEIGGQLIIDSHPGSGTRIELRVAV